MQPATFLVQVTSVMFAYHTMVRMINTRPLHPAVRRPAVAMAMASLTARMMRVPMAIPRTGWAWTDIPNSQALATVEVSKMAADLGALNLVVIGTINIARDAAWIIGKWPILAGPSF